MPHRPRPRHPPRTTKPPPCACDRRQLGRRGGGSPPSRPRLASAEAAAARSAPPVELPGRPVGLEAPRAGGKDDLTHVIGVLPIIETALNSIGVYRFDQLAEFADENVGWLENPSRHRKGASAASIGVSRRAGAGAGLGQGRQGGEPAIVGRRGRGSSAACARSSRSARHPRGC